MTVNRPKAAKALVATTLLVAAALWSAHRPASTRAARTSPAVALPHEPTAAREQRRESKPPNSTAPAPALTVDQGRAEKVRLAVDAEEARIALREKRLDELDWASPRPKPVTVAHRAESKSERAMPVAEKIRQTEILIQRLKERIAQSDQLAIRPASTAFDSSVLTARLRQRVAELERGVQLMREPESGQAEP